MSTATHEPHVPSLTDAPEELHFEVLESRDARRARLSSGVLIAVVGLLLGVLFFSRTICFAGLVVRRNGVCVICHDILSISHHRAGKCFPKSTENSHKNGTHIRHNHEHYIEHRCEKLTNHGRDMLRI